MKAFGQWVFLALLFGSSLAENKLIKVQGDTSCGDILNNDYKALPLALGANVNCIWQIDRGINATMNETIRLIFSSYELNPSSTCDKENIEIYDGPSTDAPLLGRVCKNHSSVPVFHSTSSTLTFRITTDSTEFARNFFVFYYFILPASSTIENCGGFLTSPDGTFTSPNYPKPHPEFAYCVWHIQTEANHKINLTFNEIFLELDDSCRFDFLAIYDGTTTDSGLIKQVCGRTAPAFQSSSNVMTIVLSTDYANSYRGFSARYTSEPIPVPTTPLPPEPNTSLSCSSDRMTVILSQSYLDALGYNEKDLTLNDPTCRPVALNPVIFSFPLNSCGTIKTFNLSSLGQTLACPELGKVTFLNYNSHQPNPVAMLAGADGSCSSKKGKDNTITYTNAITASPAGDVITRQKQVEIVTRCIMENNSTVEVMYVTENGINDTESALGRFNLSMAFYYSSSFSHQILDSPYYVALNQTLYAQVSLHSTDDNLLVFVDTCTASPNLDSGSPKYDLVRSGCAQDNTYAAYPVLEHYGRFRFSSFRFLQHLPSIYLHCEVLICDSTDPNSRCTKGCISRHKREASSYKWKGDAMVGPIRLKTDLNFKDRSDSSIQVYPEESQNTQSKSLYTLTFVVLVANAVLLAGLAAKHFISREPGYRYQKLQSY